MTGWGKLPIINYVQGSPPLPPPKKDNNKTRKLENSTAFINSITFSTNNRDNGTSTLGQNGIKKRIPCSQGKEGQVHSTDLPITI